MHHFFVEPGQIAGDVIRITGPDVNHMKHVLRMRPGEEVLVSDGSGRDYLCAVENLEDQAVDVRILRRRRPENFHPGFGSSRACPKVIRWSWLSRRPWSWGPPG